MLCSWLLLCSHARNIMEESIQVTQNLKPARYNLQIINFRILLLSCSKSNSKHGLQHWISETEAFLCLSFVICSNFFLIFIIPNFFLIFIIPSLSHCSCFLFCINVLYHNSIWALNFIFLTWFEQYLSFWIQIVETSFRKCRNTLSIHFWVYLFVQVLVLACMQSCVWVLLRVS